VPLNNIITDEDNRLYLDQVVTTDALSTALDKKKNKITDNSYLSISDITGLETALGNEQDDIGIYDNFIINSMYVAPFPNKTLVNPTQNGQLRASILKVEHDTLGLIDVAETFNSLTTAINGKQEEIKSTYNLSLATLETSGQITCGGLIVGGSTIQTLVDNASGSGLTKSDIDGKQDILTAGNNISIVTSTDTTTNITTNTISAINEVTQSSLTSALSNYQPKLGSGVSIITDTISAGNITARDDAAINGSTIRARSSLLIGTGTISTINVLDELNKKQVELQAGEYITIDENNIISSTGGIATTLGYASHVYEEFGIFTSSITSLTHTFENTFNVNGGTLIFTFETTAFKSNGGASTITYQILTANNEIRHVCNHSFTFTTRQHRYFLPKTCVVPDLIEGEYKVRIVREDTYFRVDPDCYVGGIVQELPRLLNETILVYSPTTNTILKNAIAYFIDNTQLLPDGINSNKKSVNSISNWDVSSLTNFSSAFYVDYFDFNSDISQWNMSNATSTFAMFFFVNLLIKT